ncbi:acetyl/propionyl/methylcrotonyl-CoA carboxylase subunit alpha [Vibrio sp. HN007]|uniref:acetyl/propionyl/methylcrotonyl-CoA carboxylase subunit alpha n=1 Tax=Vibrio iocasae TaxID=3098914 RepID=UPI0035D3DAEA
MFKRILIANRGEIACRVIKTARKLGIETIAVYSDADSSALHVKQADYAEYIGPSPASESYLDVDAIIRAATKWQAEAIHPGYGFLSENARLAQACIDNRIAFIGPSANAINLMGSKSQAKAIMSDANVPLVPGYHGADNSVEHLIAEAEKIGYPVMLKATQGGGGKGMRVVNNVEEMPAAIHGAQREALSSFGDDQLLIEKCILQPRHVEVQVFADEHGNCLYLSDRDCSIQRRHQKVVEEAPAPGLSDQLRKQMGEAAVQAARAIDYVGAGTVEFLLDSRGEFYFMEMNTRLQVEHPVTEMITGIDLVEWQLQVADHQPLPIRQQDVKHKGHALELRIYAEDANNDFMPSTGCIEYLAEPAQNDYVRLDSGIVEGDAISEFYDPMISKLIVWGENRNIALKQLKSALKNYHISGITTNIGYLHSIISQPAFANIELDTSFLVTHQSGIEEAQNISKSVWLTLAAVARWKSLSKQQKSVSPLNQGFRLSVENINRFNFTCSQSNNEVILKLDSGALGSASSSLINVHLDDQHYQVRVLDSEHHISIDIDGVRVVFNALVDDSHTALFYMGQQHSFSHQPTFESERDSKDALNPVAPLNGIISAIMVEKGDKVSEGQALLVLEAMKMEYTISATQAATVEDIQYQLGDQVPHGAELLKLSSVASLQEQDKEAEHATSEG